MDYRNKDFSNYENYYELDIDNFDELHNELEKTIFANISEDVAETNSVYFFGHTSDYNPFNDLPGIKIFKELLKLPIDTKFMVNCVTENSIMSPHIDNSDNPWAILFPIKNTKNTKLEFYSSKNKPKLNTYTNKLGQQLTTWDINTEDLIVTHSLEVVRPTVINNQRIHGVINSNNKKRWTIALVLAGLGWDPMLAKDYFYN